MYSPSQQNFPMNRISELISPPPPRLLLTQIYQWTKTSSTCGPSRVKKEVRSRIREKNGIVYGCNIYLYGFTCVDTMYDSYVVQKSVDEEGRKCAFLDTVSLQLAYI